MAEFQHTVKLFSPWHKRDLVYGNVCFSPSIQLDNAHAALWEYWPNEEILKYGSVKAWYSWEPRWHSQYRSSLIRKVKSRLSEDEWLHYAHTNPSYRIPHITNCGSTGFYDNKAGRIAQAVTIVSNSGGRIWFLRNGLRLRNKFVTHPLVNLFGRQAGWAAFRRYGPFSRARLPSNYRGELEWKDVWMAEEQVQFFSQYKVAICLENSYEPYYFTEKFVNAARAGCIPIYHAHPTVKQGVLAGAAWVDPREYGYDVSRTIQAALNLDLAGVQAANQRWLEESKVAATHFDGVWESLARVFIEKIARSKGKA